MNKTIISILMFLTISLTGCGTASNGTQSGSTPISDPSNGKLPELTQLLIGTMKLEDTSYTVTAKQAADLLPLWQVYQSLSTSDTAAQEEVDALAEQIKETMTAEQLQAIESMQLTREDLFTLMQEQGIGMGGGQGGQNLSPEQIATAQALRNSSGGGIPNGGFAPPPGGFPEGGPGGGGGFGTGQGGQNLNPDQIATAQAARGTNDTGLNRVPPSLLNALIQFLEKKAGSGS